jgi:hypothetical protein
MNKTLQSIIASIFFTSAITFNSNAQIAIANLDRIPELKNGTTYIVMKDPDFPGAKEYIEMFKRTWTISKIQFIKYSDVHNHYDKGNYFLSIGGYKFDEQYTPMFGGFFGGADGNTNDYPKGAWFKETYIYLELWTCTDNYLENKKDKELKINNTIQLARIDAYTDIPAYKEPKYLYAEEYNSTVRIRNWGVGILENYVQSMMTYFNNNQERKLYSAITNNAELAKLKTETLYVPNYLLIQYDKKTNGETGKHIESDLFEKYTLKHKLLTIEELNTKISNKEEPIYYFIYVKSRVDKFVSVVNSVTGEMIYSRYTPMSYNIQPDDLYDLQLAIQSK